MTNFVYTKEEDGIRISKHIGAEYIDCSRIDGYPMMLIKKDWDYYRKWIKAELVRPLVDNLPVYMGYPITPNIYEGKLVIKITEHDPELFNYNVREEKLKRLNG